MWLSRRILLGAGVKASFLLPSLAEAASKTHPTATSGEKHAPSPVPPLVMLDPGHGGKDPGAIGVSGTYEKHIALATAFELKRRLELGGRYRVQMTRARDVFIPLEDRVSLAQRARATLFVSMHADAVADHSVRGASVYTLADRASDTQTAELAKRENAADRFGPMPKVSPDIARILSSLVRQETRLGSARMAHSVVASLDDQVPALPNPARHARFAVLEAADIPSVLVEMGFMSNAVDEAALRRPDHRARVAQAMERAVEAWFAAAGATTRQA